MSGLEQLWAGWRYPYVTAVDSGDAAAAGPPGAGEQAVRCVFCWILSVDGPDEQRHLVAVDEHAAVVLNAYPYTSGHVLVLPRRHVGELEELSEEESAGLWAAARRAVAAIRGAYRPDGVNLGANLGKAAGAGIPEHLHLHALPRWVGDTNFMTTVAGTRVLPESLDVSWQKLRQAWPGR